MSKFWKYSCTVYLSILFDSKLLLFGKTIGLKRLSVVCFHISNNCYTNISDFIIHFEYFFKISKPNKDICTNILDGDQCFPTSDVNVDSENCVGLLAVGQNNSFNNQSVYVTVCDERTAKMQLPILFTAVLMILILGISCGAVYILHRMLDPVKMLRLSRLCFPARCFDSIWPDDQTPILGPILHFLLNPCKQTLDETNTRLVEKTGQDLAYWSIKHGYLETLQQIILGIDIDLPMVKTAIMEGEARIIALVLSNAGHLQTVTANIPVVLKTLSEKRGMTCKVYVQ